MKGEPASAQGSAAEAQRVGWGWPATSRKAHYFRGSLSLCGKWLFGGELFDDKHDSLDNCAACRRKRAPTQPKGPMMTKTMMLAAALILTAFPALAEGGWSANQASNPHGDRGERGGRQTAEEAYRQLRRDFPGQSTHAQERSSGVGDRTGHSAQMRDKAVR